MNNCKTRTFSDFKKQIVVTDWLLHNEGLELHYDFAGKELNLIADTEQACTLLKQIGAIEDFQMNEGTLEVQVEIDWNSSTKAVWISYDAFLMTYDFSQYEAIDCAAMHESEKQFRAIMGGGKKQWRA